jgi:hypothetical protein
VLVGEPQILPQLYKRVMVPQAVLDGIKHPAAPGPVARFVESLPQWLDVVKIDLPDRDEPSRRADLDPDEVEAITLAMAHQSAFSNFQPTGMRFLRCNRHWLSSLQLVLHAYVRTCIEAAARPL